MDKVCGVLRKSVFILIGFLFIVQGVPEIPGKVSFRDSVVKKTTAQQVSRRRRTSMVTVPSPSMLIGAGSGIAVRVMFVK